MKKLATSINSITFAATVPVLHPVRSAHGSSFFNGKAVQLVISKTFCNG